MESPARGASRPVGKWGLLKPDDWSAKWIASDLTSRNAALGSLAIAKWIWCPEPGVDLTKTAPAGDRYFRCWVDVPAGETPSQAELTLTVDDQFTLYVNGEKVAHFAQRDGWKRPQHYDLRKHLHSGANVVAVAAKNIEGLAGVCAEIVVTYPNHIHVIASDRHWKTSKQAAKGWNTAGFDDSAWQNSFEIADFGKGVWKNVAADATAAPVPFLRKEFSIERQDGRIGAVVCHGAGPL